MTLTGPHGPFVIEQLLAYHTVERIAGGFVVHRDCVVRTADGVRRLYGIRTDLLGGAE